MKTKFRLPKKVRYFLYTLLGFRYFKENESENESENERKIKSLFETYFDDCYGVDAQQNTSSTYTMGIYQLNFDEHKNILSVHLRRPGLLIGKQGSIIEAVEKYLECKIKIIEVKRF